MDLAERCYVTTRCFPQSELYGMTGQIRRASASIPANIAEGYGRGTTGAYVQFLRTSQGSLKELETHLLLATRVNLLSKTDCEGLLATCDEIGRMLQALIRKLQTGPARS